MRTYAAECENSKVRVNLFSPGQTRTRMMATAFPGDRSRDAADAGRRGEGDRAVVHARIHRERENLRFPSGKVPGVQSASLSLLAAEFRRALLERGAEDVVPKGRRHAEISAIWQVMVTGMAQPRASANRGR